MKFDEERGEVLAALDSVVIGLVIIILSIGAIVNVFKGYERTGIGFLIAAWR